MTRRAFRVLLVEDDPLNVELFSTVLRRDGYAIEVVTDGREVEQRVEVGCPDLVLMDINLPGVNGTELMRRLRRNPAAAGLRILALTAHAMRGDAENFVAAGFDGYIPKPVEMKQFRETVRRILEALGTGSDEGN